MLRSEIIFNFKTDCIFCGKTTESRQFHDKGQVVSVRTLEIKSTLQDICMQRNDSLSHSVMARIEYSQDLRASDTVYHRQCSTNFRTFKQIPVTYRDDKEDGNLNPSKRGRPSDTEREHAFL